MNNSNGKKPFPWRCSQCREKAVYEAVIDCTRQMPHDGREYTITVKSLRTPKCSNCGQVLLDSDAFEVLYAELRRVAQILTPQQIHEYRSQSGLSQAELATAMGVSVETVERWETGGQIQTRSMDTLLRLFFGVPQVREILTAQQVGTLGFHAGPTSAPSGS